MKSKMLNEASVENQCVTLFHLLSNLFFEFLLSKLTDIAFYFYMPPGSLKKTPSYYLAGSHEDETYTNVFPLNG